MSNSTTMCASCPVWTGICPICETFWYVYAGCKRIGVPRRDDNPYASYVRADGQTVFPISPPIDCYPGVRVLEVQEPPR